MNAQNFGAIVPRSTISAVAQARELALAKMLEAMSHLDAAQARVAEAFKAAEGAHRGFAPLITQGNPLSDLRREKLELDSLCKAYRNHLDTGIWTFLIDHSGMGDMMDRQAKAEIRATFSGDVPEATEANMTATMESLFCQISATTEDRAGFTRSFAAQEAIMGGIDYRGIGLSGHSLGLTSWSPQTGALHNHRIP